MRAETHCADVLRWNGVNRKRVAARVDNGDGRPSIEPAIG
jgi:hypothetical protein